MLCIYCGHILRVKFVYTKKYNRLPISEKSGSTSDITSDINLNYYLAKNNTNSYENIWGDRWEIYKGACYISFTLKGKWRNRVWQIIPFDFWKKSE
jgi:hypothetical protein